MGKISRKRVAKRSERDKATKNEEPLTRSEQETRSSIPATRSAILAIDSICDLWLSETSEAAKSTMSKLKCKNTGNIRGRFSPLKMKPEVLSQNHGAILPVAAYSNKISGFRSWNRVYEIYPTLKFKYFPCSGQRVLAQIRIGSDRILRIDAPREEIFPRYGTRQGGVLSDGGRPLHPADQKHIGEGGIDRRRVVANLEIFIGRKQS